MSVPILLVALLVVSIFAVGVLTGNAATTRAQDARDRRQAATQRHLNEQYRALRIRQETDEEELRWLSKQQAGMQVIDYEVTNEAPYRTIRRGSNH
jgi:Tfp pilus assembly protein PilV